MAFIAETLSSLTSDVKSSARNILEDENQVRRLEEQVEDNKTISALRETVTLQTKKISEDKFRALK